MRILAIDPGPSKSGFVLLDTEEEPPRLIDRGYLGNFVLLEEVRTADYRQLIIEMIASYGMPVGRETFETCVWIGRFMEAGRTECERIVRQDVRLHLCHSGRANDATVRQAVIDRYGGESVALGAKKCPFCKGKGWSGRQHESCVPCGGTGWEYPPGPLTGVTGDVWQALALGLTYSDRLKSSGPFPG